MCFCKIVDSLTTLGKSEVETMFVCKILNLFFY